MEIIGGGRSERSTPINENRSRKTSNREEKTEKQREKIGESSKSIKSICFHVFHPIKENFSRFGKIKKVEKRTFKFEKEQNKKNDLNDLLNAIDEGRDVALNIISVKKDKKFELKDAKKIVQFVFTKDKTLENKNSYKIIRALASTHSPLNPEFLSQDQLNSYTDARRKHHGGR